MNIDWLLYILGAMIFWDLSIHFISWMKWVEKFTHSTSVFSYYYPHFYWKKTPNGPVVRDNWWVLYERFWVSYWGIALILLLS